MLPSVGRLDVGEDGVGQFEPCFPLLGAEQIVLHARPEGLHHGIVKRVANRPERRHVTGITDPIGEGQGGLKWTPETGHRGRCGTLIPSSRDAASWPCQVH